MIQWANPAAALSATLRVLLAADIPALPNLRACLYRGAGIRLLFFSLVGGWIFCVHAA